MTGNRRRNSWRFRTWVAGTGCLLWLGQLAFCQQGVPPSRAFPIAGIVVPVPPGDRAPKEFPTFAEPPLVDAASPTPPVLGRPTLSAPMAIVPVSYPEGERTPIQGKTYSLRPRVDDGGEDQPILVTIKIDPPGPSELFRLESEPDWRERMRRDARQNYPFNRLDFPEGKRTITLENAIIRSWPLRLQLIEPSFLCYRRLYFEDLNTERYGWDLGVLQPFASVGSFYGNLGLFPLRVLTTPFMAYECNVGYCLPGDPTPYLLYPIFRD